MKKLVAISLSLGCVFAASSSLAIDLKKSKFTQVVNDVEIISGGNNEKAAVNDIFSMPDILRTGAASRAELVASDETVTRVGANTIFSFDAANRTMDLKQGSLLFHSPHGKGGGTIHTGSATASVLGTTLIVTTTPNGGLKVLDLEGVVEVKFLSGLKQKLDPGQMTFVLPGGNQLAPVIIFRLDELTQNSLLVKGFNQPLGSLPLIKNQVEKQVKLIQSGKITDTGLYAGNNATADQVEVLDPNTVNDHNFQATLGAAEAADATINHSSLTDVGIPTPPLHVLITAPFSLTENGFFGGQSFEGFVARNIAMNTPDVAKDPLIVDLSPFSGVTRFAFVAVDDFSIEGSVTFLGLSAQDELTLAAGDQFNLTPDISLRADVHDFSLASPAEMTLDGVSLYNFANDVTLNSGADISFKNDALVYAAGKLTVNSVSGISAVGAHFIGDSTIFTPLDGAVSFDGTTVDANGHVIIIASRNISLQNSTINSDFVSLNGSGTSTIDINNTALNMSHGLTAVALGNVTVENSTLTADAGSGSVSVNSTYGSASITGTSVTAHYLTVNSGDGILLNACGQTLAATGTGATASFTAPNKVTLCNADFGSFAVMNVAADTVTINNVKLSPITNVGTLTGNVNVNGPAEYGWFNLNNSSWQGQQITSANQVTLSSGPGSTPGIYSFPK